MGRTCQWAKNGPYGDYTVDNPVHKVSLGALYPLPNLYAGARIIRISGPTIFVQASRLVRLRSVGKIPAKRTRLDEMLRLGALSVSRPARHRVLGGSAARRRRSAEMSPVHAGAERNSRNSTGVTTASVAARLGLLIASRRSTSGRIAR